jgi:hypothetical protein
LRAREPPSLAILEHDPEEVETGFSDKIMLH